MSGPIQQEPSPHLADNVLVNEASPQYVDSARTQERDQWNDRHLGFDRLLGSTLRLRVHPGFPQGYFASSLSIRRSGRETSLVPCALATLPLHSDRVCRAPRRPSRVPL